MNQGRNNRVIAFVCNWLGYLALDESTWVIKKLPRRLVPIKVRCLGVVDEAMILQALANEAEKVLLVGCPPEHCQYRQGSQKAATVLEHTRQLLEKISVSSQRVQTISITEPPWGETLIKKLKQTLSES